MLENPGLGTPSLRHVELTFFQERSWTPFWSILDNENDIRFMTYESQIVHAKLALNNPETPKIKNYVFLMMCAGFKGVFNDVHR